MWLILVFESETVDDFDPFSLFFITITSHRNHGLLGCKEGNMIVHLYNKERIRASLSYITPRDYDRVNP